MSFFSHGIGKVLKTIAPVALSFIPGVGTVAGAALGAGIGALGGGGIKGIGSSLLKGGLLS